MNIWFKRERQEVQGVQWQKDLDKQGDICQVQEETAKKQLLQI